jgi:hypothetical protein
MNVLPHACYEDTDSRTCYELRYYGYSPMLRHKEDHSEGAWLPVDEDGDCECSCHDDEDADDPY